MSPIALRLLLGRGLSAIWAWLCHRSFWQLCCMALAAFALLQHFQLAGERRHSAKVEIQLRKATERLDQIDRESRAFEAKAKALSETLRKRTDEENRANDRDADALKLRGPGKAICRPAPTASGDDKGSAKPDAPGPALPPDDRAAVPWAWLTDRAKEHDQLRTETEAWHEWYRKLVENWPKR